MSCNAMRSEARRARCRGAFQLADMIRIPREVPGSQEGGGGAGGREAPAGRGSGGLIAGVFAPQSVCGGGGGGGRRFLESNYGIRRAAAILREGCGLLSPININSGAHRRLTSYCPPSLGQVQVGIDVRNTILRYICCYTSLDQNS